MKFFRGIVDYFSTSLAELKKVVWPSRAEVINHTLVIAGSVIVAIIILGIVDFGLTTLLRFIILNQTT